MADATTPTGPIHGEHRWDAVFAAIYDRIMGRGEELGMRERRRDLVARASGRTLEIGAGTGLNIHHYPRDLPELVLAEPFEPMRRRLQQKLSGTACTRRGAISQRGAAAIATRSRRSQPRASRPSTRASAGTAFPRSSRR